MNVFVTIGGRPYRLGQSVDLSLPLDFHGLQSNAYGVPLATAKPFSGDGFTLDVRAGGSCNCETITFTPHCNGTHTESAGHLSRERFPIADVEMDLLIPATLITVQPEGRAITADAIEIVKYDPAFVDALVIRTLPNDASKRTRQWQNESTPYLTPEAMTAIRDLGVQHLLIDLPSVDPLHDGGVLAAHRVFWEMLPGSQELPEQLLRTITELIYVPQSVSDGRYVLSIQRPNFVSDAAPSRPLLFPLAEEV